MPINFYVTFYFHLYNNVNYIELYVTALFIHERIIFNSYERDLKLNKDTETSSVKYLIRYKLTR